MSFALLSEDLTRQLEALAPAGYWVLRRVRMTDRKKDIHGTMPTAWSEIYDKKIYALADPVFFWSMLNQGTIRWSEIKFPDYRGVMKKAKDYGLEYGVVTSRNEGGRHSIVSLARSDREFADEEMLLCSSLMDKALAEADRGEILKPVELAVLQDLADGLTLEASAVAGDVAISTVKNRLNSAKNLLEAKTSTQAVAEAIRRNLI